MRDDRPKTIVTLGEWRPPHSEESEKALAGVLLTSPDLADDILGEVRSEDFYAPAHRTVVELLAKMNAAGEVWDLVSVCQRLGAEGTLEACGGMAYLAELASGVVSAFTWRSHAKTIRSMASRRAVIDASCKNIAHALEEHDGEEVLDSSVSRLNQILDGDHVQEARRLGQGVQSLTTSILARKDGQSSEGWRTGLEPIDRNMCGLHPGQLVVVAARPGVGKTAVGLQIAVEAARAGTPSMILSLEMAEEELSGRTLSSESGVAFGMIQGRYGNFSEDGKYAIQKAAARLEQLPVFVDDQAGMKLDAVTRRIRQMVRRHGVKVVVVDYLQLIQPNDRKTPRYEHITEASQTLKRLAKELKICVVALAQLNRDSQGQNTEPALHHIKESGSIEQDADAVILLHDLGPTPDNRAKRVQFHIAKHRNGPTGKSVMIFDGTTQTFKPEQRLAA